MIHSMTGYGDAQAAENGITYRVEIRSLNNRYFKASIKLPEQLQLFETEVDKLLRNKLGRGSVTYSLRTKDETPASAYSINKAALAHYVTQLREAAGGDGSMKIDMAPLLELPGVCQPPDLDESMRATQWASIERLTLQAIDRLSRMRENEGRALLVDLMAQLDVIRRGLTEVQARSPRVVADYHAKLKSRVQELLASAKIKIDEDMLAREVAIFADRCDVNEEIARLASHLQQFDSLAKAPEEAGRKLEFLTQEMLREANTIGSKANDVEIARHIVEIKASIDRIKEQVQNVE